MRDRRPHRRLVTPPAPSPLHITRIVRPRAIVRIVGEFNRGASVRALVKKWRLNATGVEDVIRTAVRA